MKVNNKKEAVVFEDLKYGDVFSFSQFGNNAVYIKIKDSNDAPEKTKELKEVTQ